MKTTAKTADRIDLRDLVPTPWKPYLEGCEALEQVEEFLLSEMAADRPWHPDPPVIFRGLSLVDPQDVLAVVVGQDPYPTLGVPTGLPFAVSAGVRIPVSLSNIFTEFVDDLGGVRPVSGDLEPWARQVLMLNVAATTRVGVAAAHSRCGWQAVTLHLLTRFVEQHDSVVLICWGRDAQGLAGKLPLRASHAVITSNHPSGLSARRGPTPFFGSRPFSRTNETLRDMGRPPIDWQL